MQIDVNRELDRLLGGSQHDPFQVLGWQVIHREPLTVVIRTYQPRAETVRLVLGRERLPMYRMRDAGLFEVVLANRGLPEEYLFEVVYPDRPMRIFHDPYRFPPLLTEFDRYLFNNGTHYELYEKMGAHPAEVQGIGGVVFRVWAPAAVRVSVLGNFNDWDGRVHQMRCLGSSGIWELFIPEVKEGESYKLEIRDRDGMLREKADPFQFHAEPRPKRASVVTRLDFGWHDEEWLASRRSNNACTRPLSIYEVHAGSWQRDPGNPGRFLSFRELADKLMPYAKDMGFTHLELLPVMEHVRDHAGGVQVSGYFAPSSRYGPPRDLMSFIDQCHRNGLGVILDWVPGQLPTDGHGLTRFDGSSLFEEEHPGEGGKLLFRYRRKEVANFLIASVLFWLDKYHVDGIRMEAVTSMLYRSEAAGCGGRRENPEAIDFLAHLNRVVAGRFPGVIMTADERSGFFGVTRTTEAGGLGFAFNWDQEWAAATLDYFCTEPRFRKFHHGGVIQPPPREWMERPLLPLSHKEVVPGRGSLLARMPGDKWQQFAGLRLLYLLLWCRPGKKLLFMGNEFGQLSEWRSQVSLDWHLIEDFGYHRQLQQFVKELNRFYQAQPALWEEDYGEGGLRWLAREDAERSIVVFARQGRIPEDHLVCLLNFTPAVHHDYPMAVPFCIRYQEVLCSDESRFGGSNVCNPHLKEPFGEPVENGPCHVLVSVPPLGGIILKPEGESGGELQGKQEKMGGKSDGVH
ncbi:MAG: 1,4-alpha-glucan branching enzyme [Desulfobacteraceae bacterium]|nr:1,4-alpha-glucan branching enzyme [Desulfobacteraceae bacterium]